jgi:AraC-like DNA-binding protein
MMRELSYVTQAGIFFECSEKKQLILEQIVPEHILTHVYTGKVSVTTADKTYLLSAGQSALFSRNQLAKFNKEPDGKIPCKAVTVFFTGSFLQQFYAIIPLGNREANHPKVLQIEQHPLLDNLFQSISVYANLNETLVSDELVLLKVKEAITIIRTLNKNVDFLLSDFSEPHKIDLAGFMSENFMFNISISRFAYLTGRSLATFKRDFKKTFATTPQRWLTKTRLEQAHFLIAEKRQKPSQAYIEVGFESFSHFTYAFKRHFGYNPSSIFEPVNK